MTSGNHQPPDRESKKGRRSGPEARFLKAPARDDGNGRQPAGPAAGETPAEILSPAELAEIWARRAYVLAEEPPAVTTGETMDLLVLRLGGERYGFEVGNAREIYPLEQLTPVPRTPDFVAGVFSARGRILSVINLRAFFDLPAAGSEESQAKIMVVANTDPALATAQMEVGLLVDEVLDVVTVFKAGLEPPLTTHSSLRADYIQGVTTDLLVVLDLNALLSDKRLIVHEEFL